MAVAFIISSSVVPRTKCNPLASAFFLVCSFRSGRRSGVSRPWKEVEEPRETGPRWLASECFSTMLIDSVRAPTARATILRSQVRPWWKPTFKFMGNSN